MKAALALLVALALAGCVTNQSARTVAPTSRSHTLPPVPAHIRRACERAGVSIPDRDLTREDVESLWKQDRVTIVALRTQCGQALQGWYNGLRNKWR